MEDAISYRRFSSPKQARGDSQRRQTDLAAHYCRRHSLALIDTYLDAGLSGFTGENLSDGSALTALLQAARAGKFRRGTHLIVESLDRLSRGEISMAVRLFLDILDIGLVIVTLIDGEQVFTKERVDSDLTALIIAIVYLSRANNESKNRRERARQAQQVARKRARECKVPITAECPAWLTLARRRGVRRFVVNKDRAQVVERIFKMAVAGQGQYQIARFLSEHAVPTFSGKPKWRPGMIAHLLASEAVIGRFHPCLSTYEEGKRRRVPDPEGPIENYFPAIISEELFNEGRLASHGRLTRRKPRKIPAYTNLVVRLGRCAVCGAALHHYGSADRWAYLRCANARQMECTNRSGFPYRRLEVVLLALDDLTELVATLGFPEGSGSSAAEQEVHRIEASDREAFLSRFKAARTSAHSTDAHARDFGRRALIGELRRVLEGVVLHPNRTITVHMKPASRGCRVVYVLDHEGLQGIQLRRPEGTTGFVGRSVLAGLAIGADLQSCESVAMLHELLKRIQIVYSADGDWQAIAPDPLQITDAVSRAERALGTR